MEFSERLKELRKKRGFSQEKLASLIKEQITGDIKRNTISNYENRKSTPDFNTLKAIGHALQTTMDQLLGFQPENSEVIKSFVNDGALKYGPEEFLKPFEKKIDGIKKLLIDGKANEKELTKHLRISLKMNQDLVKKNYELYDKHGKAYSIIKRELDPS